MLLRGNLGPAEQRTSYSGYQHAASSFSFIVAYYGIDVPTRSSVPVSHWHDDMYNCLLQYVGDSRMNSPQGEYWLSSRIQEYSDRSGAITVTFGLYAKDTDAFEISGLYLSNNKSNSYSKSLKPIVQIPRTSVIVGDSGNGKQNYPWSLSCK